MSNYETQEMLNARAAQNRENAVQADRHESAARRVKTRHKGTLKLVIRLAFAATVAALILLLEWLGLVAPVLAYICVAIDLAWASAWFGAWLQLMASMRGRTLA